MSVGLVRGYTDDVSYFENAGNRVLSAFSIAGRVKGVCLPARPTSSELPYSEWVKALNTSPPTARFRCNLSNRGKRCGISGRQSGIQWLK